MSPLGTPSSLATFYLMDQNKLIEGSKNPSKVSQLFNKVSSSFETDKTEKQTLIGKANYVEIQPDNLDGVTVLSKSTLEFGREEPINSHPHELGLGLGELNRIARSLTKIKECAKQFFGFKKKDSNHELKDALNATLDGVANSFMGASRIGGAITAMSGSKSTSLTLQDINILGSVGSGIFGIIWIKEMSVAIKNLKNCIQKSANNTAVTAKEVLLEVSRLMGSGIMLAATGMGYAVTYGTVGPVVQLISSILTGIGSFFMATREGISFRDWFNSKGIKIEKSDKFLYVLNMMIVLSSISAFIALNVISGGAPLAVLILGSLTYTIWLAISGATTYRAFRAQ